LPCLDYENRPRICREFTCGHECTHCQACERNAVIGIPGAIDPQDVYFLELHGITVTQNEGGYTLDIPAVCKNWTE